MRYMFAFYDDQSGARRRKISLVRVRFMKKKNGKVDPILLFSRFPERANN